jgi:CarD family transcriptional regulator
MAARKKSAKNARSKTARKKTVSSAKRPHRTSRGAPSKSSKGSGKSKSAAGSSVRGAAAAGKKRSSARKTEKKTDVTTRRKETRQGGKATVTGGVKKRLKPNSSGVAVAEKLNGKASEAKLQAKSVQKTKAQARSEESALTINKTDPATVPTVKAAEEPAVASVTASPKAAAPAPVRPKPAPAAKEEPVTPSKTVKAPAGQRQGFKLNEFVVYPAHGVGQIVAIEEQEVAGFRLELFVISFAKDKMTLRVPTSKVTGVGMRKISDADTAKRSLDILSGRARIKRTMWSRRAQEYETKINSGDIAAIAEVVRDLYRSEAQPEQSYSERQLYEAALDRMVREIAAVQKSNEIDALKAIESQLQKTHVRPAKAGSPDVSDPEIEEAA